MVVIKNMFGSFAFADAQFASLPPIVLESQPGVDLIIPAVGDAETGDNGSYY